MLNFITEIEKLEDIEARARKHFIELRKESRDNFSDEFKIVYGFQFEIIFETFFFNTLIETTEKLNEDKFFFYVVDPSPRDYFYHHFKKYNTFEIPKSASDNDFNALMMFSPDGSSADAIAINSSTITLFADSGRWACIGFRDEEVGLIAFKDIEARNAFFSAENCNHDYYVRVTGTDN